MVCPTSTVLRGAAETSRECQRLAAERRLTGVNSRSRTIPPFLVPAAAEGGPTRSSDEQDLLLDALALIVSVRKNAVLAETLVRALLNPPPSPPRPAGRVSHLRLVEPLPESSRATE